MTTQTKTLEDLASFADSVTFESMPADVVDETKRIILDALGCTIGAIETQKGSIGIDVGLKMGGRTGEAAIFGTRERSSIFGAAFANAELMNSLDYDPNLPPGHVTPYVLPPALAVAEMHGTSGKDLITSVAIAHEISNRLGRAIDHIKDRGPNGETPRAIGYSSAVFGGAVSALKLEGASRDVIANGLGIAGFISPVNPVMAWAHHVPTPTIKYTVGGAIAVASLTAASMASLGHRGDRQLLDDAEYGYGAMIGSRRWDSGPITHNLGTEWGFVSQLEFKPYPIARGLHGTIDALLGVLEEHDIKPSEIDAITVYVEPVVLRPAWLNRDIQHVADAQFSIPHGIALSAHRVPPGKGWHDPKLMFSPSVMGLMNKVTVSQIPNYVVQTGADKVKRPAIVEVTARGQKFTGKREYARGTRSANPATYISTEELIEKFVANVDGIIEGAIAKKLAQDIAALDGIPSFKELAAKIQANTKPAQRNGQATHS